MNKNLYRIVFNKARGMLMVVAEIARSGGAGGGRSSGLGHTLSKLTGKLSALCFSLWLALGAVMPVQAAVVADGSAAGNQRPTVINTANGVPQVNIQTPGKGGVSRNVYSQFDVENKGVILNNSHANAQSQLGGMVTANPWLAKGEAKVILNEVNARDSSKLNGFIEVAGKTAQVVIANPAGITCDGCGFINAARTSLTTGNVQMKDGVITGYDVSRGEIVVQGNGLDASRSSHTDLIARSVKVNAGIWASELEVTTGANLVDATHQDIRVKEGDYASRPTLAVDISQLGGMYAGKIRLIGTEKGVGVRNAGNIGTSAGDVVVNADGTLSNIGSINASQHIKVVTGGDLVNEGTLYASATTDLKTKNGLSNNGIIAACGDTSVKAASITSQTTGVLVAGLKADGTLGDKGNLTLNSEGKLHTQGQNLAASAVTIQARSVDLGSSQTAAPDIAVTATGGDISTANASIMAGQGLRLTTDGMLNNDGGNLVAEKLTLAASELSNRQGIIQQQGDDELTLAMRRGINNREGVIASNGKNLNLSGSTLQNQSGKIIHAGNGQLSLSGGKLDGEGGTLISNGSLVLSSGELNLNTSVTQAESITLQAESLSHRSGQMTQTGSGLMHLTIGRAIDNTEGYFSSNGNMQLAAGTLNNQSGSLISAGESGLHLNLDGDLNNRGGLIAATASLYSLTDAIDNTGGLMQAEDLVDINSRGNSLINSESGEQGGVISFGELRLSTGDIINQHGQIAASLLSVNAGAIANQSGKILADDRLDISSAALNNFEGRIQSGDALTLNTHQKSINNKSGMIAATGSMTLSSGEMDNRGGQLVSGEEATLVTGALDNRNGQLTVLGDFSLTTLKLQNDNGGMLQSGGNLLIDTQGRDLSNSLSGDTGGITSQGNMSLQTGDLNNQSGTLIASQQLSLNARTLNNSKGQLAALEALNAISDALNNSAGTVQSGAELNWDTRSNKLNNDLGTLSAQSVLTITSGDLVNTGGLLASGDKLQANSTKLDNSNGGQIAAREALTLKADEINNTLGQIQSLSTLELNASASLFNKQGVIQSSEQLVISATTLTNNDTRESGDGIMGRDVVLTVGELQNGSGEILADSSLNLTVEGKLDNNLGLLSSQKAAEIKASSVLNLSGDIETGTSLALRADTLSGEGKLFSLGDMTLTLKKDFHNLGTVQANNSLSLITAGTLTNSALIQSGTLLDVQAASLVNNAKAEFSSGNTQLTASGVLTNYGLIDGFYTRLKALTLNNTGSGRIYGDALAIQAARLNNMALAGRAPVIAARQRMDLGVGVLNNYEHSLIYSDGSLFVGGSLNTDYQATGKASVINNHSATIESSGSMVLNVGTLNNVNDHFSVENVLVSKETISEYMVPKITGDKRYNDKDYDISVKKDETNIIRIEGVESDNDNGDQFTHYKYLRTITEDRVKESDPGQIIAGGHLSITAGKVLNDKSQIVAGGTLAIQADSVENVEVEAYRQIVDEGTATSYWRISQKGGDKPGKKEINYKPEEIIQGIDLKASTLEEFTRGKGSGANIADHQAAEISGDIQGTGDLQLADLNGPTARNGLPVVPGAIVLPSGKTFEVKVGDAGSVVRIVGPNTRVPDNSLFQLRPGSSANYLIETDPRFTSTKQWLGSDYMMQAFTRNHDNVLKRLGDGYYEQKLIREQIIAMTGQRFLSGYSSDEDQFKQLMNEGIEFGNKYNLIPGVALTAEQMALLTGDMVWMVTQTVRLPDGSSQQVLVPQVYATVKEGDLDGSGALLAGKNVSLNLTGDLINSGRITSQQSTQVLTENINNIGGIIRGNDVALQARTDINNIGGMISGTESLFATAGRDINAATTTRSSVSADGNYARTAIDRVAGFYVEQADGKLALQAGRDINLTAAQVVNGGKNSQTVIAAGRDLNLTTVTTANRENLNFSKDNWQHQSATQQVGSEITGGGDVTLSAQHDVSITAGSVNAGATLAVGAGNDINITHGTDTSSYDFYSKTTGRSSIASKTTTETRDTMHQESVNSSSLSGDTVTMQAGKNITVTGSSVAATGDLAMAAGNNLTIQSATESRQESHLHNEKKSGLSGTGGVGVTLGSSSVKTTDEGSTLSNVGSMVGSTGGNVSLNAGSSLTVIGSDVLAGKDMSLTGKEVNILAAENQSKQTHTVEQRQSGVTLALSGAAGSAINSAVATAVQASNESDSRLAALEGMKAALTGVQAAQSQSLAEAGGSQGSLVGVNISYGSQSSKSTQTATQNQNQGSTLTAGNNLTINATGTDINVQGSQLQAGNDASLSAARDVNLVSSQDSHTLEGKNESKGGSVGVGINFGQGGNGLSLNASVNTGKGKESGNGTTHNETTVNAGNNLSINSGRDTTLTGAQVSGDKVTLDVGRNLTLTSEQDTDYYDSKQQNASAGGSISFSGSSGSLSLSQDKMHSSFESVQEQTGIFAGQGGFDISVGEHTQLNGAVIGSTATADKNRLDTGTLGFSDIENSAEYEVEHQSVGVSTGGSVGGQFAANMANNFLTGANSEGSDNSTTRSAISDGSITIRDMDKQQQDVNDLSRDVEHANQTLSPIFDKEKEQRRLQEAQLIGEIGAQVGDIARTQGQIVATKAANEKMATATDADRQAAKEQWTKANPGQTPSDKDITDQVYSNFYNQAFNESGFGTGGAIQQGISAATAAIQGLAGGDIGAAIAGGAAPYLAEAIHNMTTDPVTGKVNAEANLMAHAVLGAIAAQASGNSALAGTSGAMMGEYIAQQMYPGIKREDLTEAQRQTLSALATLAAGLAGGVTGDSTADAVAGAESGKNSSNNNNLGGLGSYGQAAATLGTSMIEAGATSEEINTAMSRNAKGDLPEGANITKVIVDGYKDGVLTAGAWYLGPVATVGKALTGGVLAEIANGTYQWFDINSEKNQNLPEYQQKTWSFKGSFSAGIMGTLAPGRGILPNVGIAAGGAVFTDGADVGAVGGAAAGAWAGGKFGELAPGVVNSVTGKELPGFIFDATGYFGGEVLGGYIKDGVNGNPQSSQVQNGDNK